VKVSWDLKTQAQDKGGANRRCLGSLLRQAPRVASTCEGLGLLSPSSLSSRYLALQERRLPQSTLCQPPLTWLEAFDEIWQKQKKTRRMRKGVVGRSAPES
jgi:hypothetical protein